MAREPWKRVRRVELMVVDYSLGKPCEGPWWSDHSSLAAYLSERRVTMVSDFVGSKEVMTHSFGDGGKSMTKTTDLAATLASWKVKAKCPCNGQVSACWGMCAVCLSGECCGGMGEVYLLDDSVRVPFLSTGPCGHPEKFHNDPDARCQCCQTHGWTASTDLAVWEQAIFQAWPTALIVKEHDHTRLQTSRTPSQMVITEGSDLPALLLCVKQVLEKEAANEQ